MANLVATVHALVSVVTVVSPALAARPGLRREAIGRALSRSSATLGGTGLLLSSVGLVFGGSSVTVSERTRV